MQKEITFRYHLSLIRLAKREYPNDFIGKAVGKQALTEMKIMLIHYDPQILLTPIHPLTTTDNKRKHFLYASTAYTLVHTTPLYCPPERRK